MSYAKKTVTLVRFLISNNIMFLLIGLTLINRSWIDHKN